MAALGEHHYGKSRIRVVHVDRSGPRHVVTELSVDVYLWGADFARTYLSGDNSTTVPTDTMKNTVYALAKIHPVTPIESFAESVAQHFKSKYAQVTQCKVDIRQPLWERLDAPDGQEGAHKTAFAEAGPCYRTASATTRADGGADVVSGFKGLRVLKTTGSGFEGFPRCEYTTLPEMHDRLLCTSVTANWTFARGSEPGYGAALSMIRNVTLDFSPTAIRSLSSRWCTTSARRSWSGCLSWRRSRLSCPTSMSSSTTSSGSASRTTMRCTFRSTTLRVTSRAPSSGRRRPSSIRGCDGRAASLGASRRRSVAVP
ncbi:uricase [Thecamonas trahens ATCC 50062]|uniref:Uricase n=1 Tax=Thecamonas trahens ATCC 50062 TaxID=461836 RepID=A0A0L0DUC7_THETB|nr:uricase [Thecamonas trahens ATCC 50062]KNC55939.1 uricase [Thecamonas trahens ATCC 50062]|eukprot:XP_013752711.1 uricase [Thecamonas trahens ATCC 50062]